LASTEKRIGDGLVCPIGTLDIGFEQNIGSPNFLRGASKFFDDGEADLLYHGTPELVLWAFPCRGHFCSFVYSSELGVFFKREDRSRIGGWWDITTLSR